MSWVSVDDVVEALGTPTDDPFLDTCTDAANAFAFRRRKSAGYKDDSSRSPGVDVSQGTVMYAVTLFRERGSVDSFASFDEFATGAVPTTSMGQVLRLLGVPKPQVDRKDSDLAWKYRHAGYRGYP